MLLKTCFVLSTVASKERQPLWFNTTLQIVFFFGLEDLLYIYITYKKQFRTLTLILGKINK